ncbi:MAG TPA: adenosylcobinamide-GDP ribazoletransferase [Geothermobacteraceae bacterium]|nr:adenosylcobinamide-GDP ribazoletransferase [Geothermobacteraceae bacterium]
MKREWEELKTALGFLTVLPVAPGHEPSPEQLGRSMGFFPAAGLVIGLLLVVLNWALEALIPRPVLDCLLLLILIALTGALHLDGMADMVDGLAGGRDQAGILRIMKDSRVGAIGVVALVMLLLLKYLSLVSVPLAEKSAALMFMPCAGRWVQVVLAAFCRYVRNEGGTGRSFVEQVGERETLLATGTLLAAALVLFGMQGVFLAFLLGLAAMIMMRYFQARLGGVTGDVLGAASEVLEVLSLILVLALV